MSTLIKIGIGVYSAITAAIGGDEVLPDGNYIVDGSGAYIIGGTDVLIVDGS